MTTRRRQVLFYIMAFAMVEVSSFSDMKMLKKPYYEVDIDYSAANEYVEAHYGSLAHRTPYYFGRSIQKEPIYDAREGVYDDKCGCMKPASIGYCGFQLLNEPTQVTDWADLNQIRQVYLPELRRILQETYKHENIRDIVFWNPMLRGENLKQTRPNDRAVTPTASFAASPHIDTDIGAYEKGADLLRLFEKNQVSKEPLPMEELVEGIAEGRRFAIINAWRNIASTPVVRNPLALFSVRYDEQKAFPEAAPNMSHSRWYVFSNMTNNEVLLFCQYDRDVTRPSDLWHCALANTLGAETAPSRSSFDVRCFVVFDEIVSVQNDRYGENRLASLLTQEESGCFCDEQAERREPKEDSTS